MRPLASTLSVSRPIRMEKLGTHCTTFYDIFVYEYFFENLSKDFSSSIKIGQNNGYFTHEDLRVKVPTLSFYTHVTANRTAERPNQISSRSPGL
jgi:hypothetical protein